MLAHKGVDVHERLVSGGTPEWDAMTARTGGRTTLQILINDQVIGGYDELAVLNAQGILDEKLAWKAARRVTCSTMSSSLGRVLRA